VWEGWRAQSRHLDPIRTLREIRRPPTAVGAVAADPDGAR